MDTRTMTADETQKIARRRPAASAKWVARAPIAVNCSNFQSLHLGARLNCTAARAAGRAQDPGVV